MMEMTNQQTDFTFVVNSAGESLLRCVFLEFGVLSDFDLDFWESSILLFAAIHIIQSEYTLDT
jgi:hypothetical protein